MRSLTPLLRRLGLVEVKANPKAPETRLPFVVIDAATGEDIPGYEAHNQEHRALAQRSGVLPKEYHFDAAALYDARPYLAYTDAALLAQFRAIDEEAIPQEHDAAPLARDSYGTERRLYRTWFRSDRTIVESAAARGPLRTSDREAMWQWIEAYNPFSS